MDLQEGVKKGNVWKLESEAFKKPIEIKIWYDNHDLLEFRETCEALDKKLHDQETRFTKLQEKDADLQNWIRITQEEIMKDRDRVRLLEMGKEQLFKEREALYKVVSDLKTMTETLSWTILHLQEQVKELELKTSKQPTVIHDKWFISGHEASGLWMINLPDGDYLLIAKYVVWEHNEYVTNQDELLMDKIHVEWQHYVPFYKLEWGTELDVPTATIYYDLVFIPS
jgi:hypothetical protein